MIKADDKINEPDNDTPFMYIFVREDLPPVVKLIQTAHVTHMAGARFGLADPDLPTHFCVFGVKNEEVLESVAWRLQEQNYKFEMFFEPDNEIGHTAIAVQSLIGSDREWFKFKLLKM